MKDRIWKETELVKCGYKRFPSGAPCRECGNKTMWFAEYGSDGYEDYIYRCSTCGDKRIVEGADS